MNWRIFQYIFYLIPILWSFIQDLIFEELSLGEIRANYLFGKANAYDRANMLERSIQVYKEILRNDSKSIPVFLNLGGLYYRRGKYERPFLITKR